MSARDGMRHSLFAMSHIHSSHTTNMDQQQEQASQQTNATLNANTQLTVQSERQKARMGEVHARNAQMSLQQFRTPETGMCECQVCVM